MDTDLPERSHAMKLLLALLVGALLSIPLFSIYLLNWDRQTQSETARTSISEGWGGPQTLAGPLIAIPYDAQVTETVQENGKPVTRTSVQRRELFLAPAALEIDTRVKPERRSRSIYEAVVYDAEVSGKAQFRLPADTGRLGVDVATLMFDKAELRFGVADPRGLKPANRIVIDGQSAAAQPGNGLAATNGSGFFTGLDATPLTTRPIAVEFGFALRGHSVIALAPRAGATRWTVTSPWQHPSFTGGFLPEARSVTPDGFSATYKISNLALGTTLVSTSDSAVELRAPETPYSRMSGATPTSEAQVGLIQPVDLYSQVNRSVKYGFLFIGFTFMAFLMFDVVAGVRVSAVEYLLVGAGLVLFFVLLLAFAEVIGFTPAYLVAGGAIIALLTAYSAAVLKSRKRAGFIAALLVALYGVLYVLLSLEAYSLLIGSILLFAALAAVMYLTRNLEWGGRRAAPST
ncbi:cell envelope integrity protein CreD [Sphingomonas sp. MG17]|uniref:Cell envelope integrity protein CreD n=1 Tax=Sphingomonas tagetis TaxID=2949092 RepID=A0A9X2KK43_9SPHN|nr:cell envelope integrity protein CreD [Sphingomonas tagetis]MCP3729400.1 cell envelope integrity protein CreD [Sphingomonas tagetis]